jgi:hypothetical protein
MNKKNDGKARSGGFKQLGVVLQGLLFYVRQRKYFKAIQQIEQVKLILMLANKKLGKLSYKDAVYAERVRAFNQAMIDLTRGKWYTARAMDTRANADWEKASQNIRKSKNLAQKLYDMLHSGASTPITFEPVSLSANETEILFADGVPLVPEINPVVILQGSDYDMGYQYAQQVIQIFGPWIFERKAGRRFTEAEKGGIREWEQQIKAYAPEILEMCRGWADGATDAGVPMSYEDVLEIWTGHEPPATSYRGAKEGLPSLDLLPRPACSGVAAWGRATVDGKLVTGSSGDHDCTHMVTIVAFPQTGNNYIHTPFAAHGDIREVGPMWMMGHPGMNNKGLAYVEHGGELRMVEPQKYWGYGIRKGTSVFHILRFANTAQEAREMELSYPVGDVGRPMGSVGGFYVDSTYGYVMESRKDPVVVREAGVMGETDFLYATNNAMHPDSGQAGWIKKQKESWLWDEHGGWYPAKFTTFTLAKAMKSGAEERTLSAMSFMYENSRGRNLYAFKMLNRAIGHIDAEYMKMLYRKPGTFPPGSWKEITATYNKTGQWGDYSIGHATNALVTIMQPDNGDEGVYALCVGTAARGLTTNTPVRAVPVYNETNAFWELKLAASPAGVTAAARQKAQEYLKQACQELGKLNKSDAAYEPLKAFLDRAQSELQSGEGYEQCAQQATGNEAVYEWARATRAFTRSQVRALQVNQALVPPPNTPEDLGL